MKTYRNIRAFLREVERGKVPIEDVATVTEIATPLGVTTQAISNAAARGAIDGWRVDHMTLVDARSVRRWLVARGDHARARLAQRFASIAETSKRLGVGSP